MNDHWKKRGLSPKRAPGGWYSRGYLPHFEDRATSQALPFRLADSMPQEILSQWEVELTRWPVHAAEIERRKRMDDYLDRGEGSAWMRDPQIASIVQNALLHFDGGRYRLGAWVVMPNHVHALLDPTLGFSIGKILHSLKSFTAKECNRLLGRSGAFWQTESFDRYIRNETHYRSAVEYIERNPVKAGLCKRPEDWPWSSAHFRSTSRDDR